MYLPSDPWPRIITIQLFLCSKLHNVRFIFSFRSVHLSSRNALYRGEGKRRAAFWSRALFHCGKAAASAASRRVFCPCANIPGATDGEVRERLAAAAVCPYLLINIAVACTTFGSSMCICMMIHQIHFPWSTGEEQREEALAGTPGTSASLHGGTTGRAELVV